MNIRNQRLRNWYKGGLTGILLLLILGAAGQQVTVKGRVRDNRNRPVERASIAIVDTYDGATADSLGRFSFRTTEKGEKSLEISSIGYKSLIQKINIGTETIELDIVLKEAPNELTAVVITAGAFEASDRKKATVLDPIDIVTTASGQGDIIGALKTLPGAQQVGESEGLFVRGGTAAETKTFIDGTLVNNFFFSSTPNIASRGRFSPFIFKGTVFSAGGYSALYGQALSSALILESIDLPDRSSANLGLSVLGGSGGYQHLSKNKKASWGTNYSYTNLGPAFKIIKQQQDYFTIPSFHNLDANFRIKTSKTGILKYYGYYSTNKLGFTTPSIDSLGLKESFSLSNHNMYHNLAYKERLSNKWRLNLGLSFTTNKDDINGGMADAEGKDLLVTGLEFKRFGLNLRGTYFNAKVVMERKLKGLSAIRFGGEYNFSNDKSVFTAFNNSSFPEAVKEHLKAGFAEADIYITNDLAAKLGSRVEHSSLLGKANVAPRVSLAYKLSNFSQVSMAYGQFYQNPERRYLPSVNNLDFSKATHYILQYQKVTNLQTFRTELFYKKYQSLVKTGLTVAGEKAVDNNGFGNAGGFELFWRDKKTIKNLDYWISYSYLDTKRDFLNFPESIQPNFAAKHTASLVVKKFVLPWKTGFNFAYNYATGRPYYRIGYDPALLKYRFEDRGETPDYHNVSFSLNYLPKIGKPKAKSFVVYVLSVSNIFGIRQVFGYQYSANGLRKEPILPTSRSFVFIGAFFSFGVDRTQDVINGNL